ncbi:hypothetical protein [Roseobacter sp.]|uniref:hypothetical protein n=1 Tax=Roseobacter sp. TaxID=1907202 RepID=UPI002966452D|nr:hypothetical protein [Roseobacter sp.]MDW3183189.1 hypothetical protein [Roseobacter sp.]
MVEIAGKDGIRDWLESQDRQTQIWFAARGALRTIPGLGEWGAATRYDLALTTMRKILVVSAASAFDVTKTPMLLDRARSAEAVMQTSAEPNSSAATVARATARASNSAVMCLLRSWEAAEPVNSFLYTALSIESEALAAAVYDVNNPRAWLPLWPDNSPPAPLVQGWVLLKGQWEADPADWSFWVEWYEAILNGAPLPWDLTHRIALEITDAEWDEGQTTVARRISEIRGAYDVQVLANEIAGSAYLAQPGRPGMGHNQPPSVIDDDLPAQAHETIIWAATDELRTQAQAETPAPSRVKRALSLIAGVLKASGLWVAGTVATGISVAAVTVVKKGADAWAVQNQDKLVELIDAALRWLYLLH